MARKDLGVIRGIRADQYGIRTQVRAGCIALHQRIECRGSQQRQLPLEKHLSLVTTTALQRG